MARFKIPATPAQVMSICAGQVRQYGGRAYRYDQHWSRDLGHGPESWCGDFVAWVLQKAGAKYTKYLPGFAYVPSCYAKFAAAPASEWRTVSWEDARAGDVFILSRNGNYHYHIGFVRGRSRGGVLPTYEGNTSDPQDRVSDSEGGYLRARTRVKRLQTTGGYSVRIWRPNYTGKASSKPAKPHKPAKLAVDGHAGPATVRAIQRLAGTKVDGVISGQPKSVRRYLKMWPTVKFTSGHAGGSQVVAWMQKRLGVKADGYLGPKTIRALQRDLHVKADGYAGPNTVKALQRALNSGKAFK